MSPREPQGASGVDDGAKQPAGATAAERARVRASLAGFEDRLRRCRREAEAFFDEHRRDQRCPSELAFLLGQLHGLIEHCRDLEARYRLERVVLTARAWPEESTGARNGRTSVRPR
ncbi:MAG: hypothetical protein ACREFX_00335 [Opitutaceae bacterium]